MRKWKTWKQVLVLSLCVMPWVIFVIGSQGKCLSFFLGREVMFSERSVILFDVAWILGDVIALVVYRMAVRKIDRERHNWYQVGEIKLFHIVVWTSVICTAIWTVSLIVARVDWERPSAWLTTGLFMVMTWFWMAYLIFMARLTLTQMLFDLSEEA